MAHDIPNWRAIFEQVRGKFNEKEFDKTVTEAFLDGARNKEEY